MGVDSTMAGAGNTRPRLGRLFNMDLKLKARWNYGAESFSAQIKTLFTDGTTAMFLYRLMQASRRWHLFPLEMFFNKLNTITCNCIIGRGAEFGPGFVLIHSTGVVINGQVRGGRNVFIEHQVTIGAERHQSPQIGNDVFIGAGAKIIGAVTVGDGARIGANAVVVDDVPAYATVVGVPARVVRIRQPLGHDTAADALRAQDRGQPTPNNGVPERVAIGDTPLPLETETPVEAEGAVPR